jgi:subtilase family serine protease
MKRVVYGVVFSFVCSSILVLAQGQGQDHAVVVIPDSSVEHAGEHGVAAHTNHLLVVRPNAGPQAQTPGGLSPQQIYSAYNLSSLNSHGTIYVIDAFDYPTALNDFNKFSSTFGLPTETSTNPLASTNQVFQVVYAAGHRPRANCGWAQEAALDIEWAHAMAPNAKIVLVEAASNSFANLFDAVDVAAGDSNAREASMSWGGSEFSSEASNDFHFPTNGIVYFASSGDTGGKTIYPGVSPRVISAGGTKLVMNGSSRVSESGWSGSGGGTSSYEARPAFQDGIQALVGNKRGVPDWSFDADPNTGVSVYDSTSCQGLSGWLIFGGTSVSAPSLAGIHNSVGDSTNTTAELGLIYNSVVNGTITGANFFDITSGSAGSFSAAGGWDFVTGIGSTNGGSGK